jgi:hypothetical protein
MIIPELPCCLRSASRCLQHLSGGAPVTRLVLAALSPKAAEIRLATSAASRNQSLQWNFLEKLREGRSPVDGHHRRLPPNIVSSSFLTPLDGSRSTVKE